MWDADGGGQIDFKELKAILKTPMRKVATGGQGPPAAGATKTAGLAAVAATKLLKKPSG